MISNLVFFSYMSLEAGKRNLRMSSAAFSKSWIKFSVSEENVDSPIPVYILESISTDSEKVNFVSLRS